MSKADPSAHKKERKKTIRWVVTIFLVTIFVAGIISALSDVIMANSSVPVAFLILFDIIGMAVASADEKPFHAMAARKVAGAKEAIALLRNAERVSSICNDVVGDICGVISGSASALIASQIIVNFEFSWPRIISLCMSALAAGLTVGGKAIGKTFAVNSSTEIVHGVGRAIYMLHNLPKMRKKKKK